MPACPGEKRAQLGDSKEPAVSTSNNQSRSHLALPFETPPLVFFPRIDVSSASSVETGDQPLTIFMQDGEERNATRRAKRKREGRRRSEGGEGGASRGGVQRKVGLWFSPSSPLGKFAERALLYQQVAKFAKILHFRDFYF